MKYSKKQVLSVVFVLSVCMLMIAGLIAGSTLSYWVRGNKTDNTSILIFVSAFVILGLGIQMIRLVKLHMEKKAKDHERIDK